MFESIGRIFSGKSGEEAALEKKIMAQVKRDMAVGEAVQDNLVNKATAKKTVEEGLENAITAEEQGDQMGLEQACEAIRDGKDAERSANANLIAINRATQQASQIEAEASTAKAIHVALTTAGSSMSIGDIVKVKTETKVAQGKNRAQSQQLSGAISDLSSARIGSGGISTDEVRSLIEARKEVRQQSAEKKLDNILERLDGVDQTSKRKQS